MLVTSLLSPLLLASALAPAQGFLCSRLLLTQKGFGPALGLTAITRGLSLPLVSKPLISARGGAYRQKSMTGPLGSAAISADVDGDGPGFRRELGYFNTFLNGAAWVGWWSQVILTTVAGVILAFTNKLEGGGPPNWPLLFGNGFVAATLGVVLGFVSMIWTWGIPSVGRALKKKSVTPRKGLGMLRGALRGLALLNMFGLMTSLVGAEQFIGTLMMKIMSQQSGIPQVGTTATVRPIDIFTIQANANTCLSHFISLACALLLMIRSGRLAKALDTPDAEIEDSGKGNIVSRVLGSDFFAVTIPDTTGLEKKAVQFQQQAAEKITTLKDQGQQAAGKAAEQAKDKLNKLKEEGTRQIYEKLKPDEFGDASPSSA